MNAKILTKQQMVEEIMSNCKWSATTYEKNVNRAMRNKYERILEIFVAYYSDKEHYRFYAELLAR